MKTRIITGVGLFVAICSVLLLSGFEWFLNTVVALLCVAAVFEIYRAAGAKDNRALFAVSCVAAAVLPYIAVPYYEYITAVLFAAAVVLFTCLMAKNKQIHSIHPALSALIALFIICFYKTMTAIRSEKFGFFTLTLAVVICNVDDIAAYFVGKGCGRHKLAPVISPNKTVEGSIGGVVCSVAVFLAVGFALDKVGVVSVNYGRLAVYLAIASVIGQLGDLSMSAVKRIAGIKDYGRLFPGHGGVLDRFDSLMFVLPFTYLFCSVTGPIFS